MKIFFVIIICTLYYSDLSAQTFGGIITYGEKIVNSSIDTTKIRNSNVKSIIAYQMLSIKNALSGDEELYTLKFNRTESIFKHIPFLVNDANPHLKRAISQGVYYTNLVEKEKIHQLYAFDQNYIIKSKFDKMVWDITKETKIIDNYLCYKAITQIENYKKIKTQIIAWFTTEIPFGYGPKNYRGLPGLILALNERGHYFYAMKIELNKDSLKIQRPKKGKEITEEDFINIGRDAMSEMRKNN